MGFDSANSVSAAAGAGVQQGQDAAPKAEVLGRHAWRGLLIALIVLGHNRIFYHQYYYTYRVLYNFHVAAFLIIPFLRLPREGVKMSVLHPLKLYYQPFVVFVTLYALMLMLSGSASAPYTWWEWSITYNRALILADTNAVDAATGFKMFWFMPVFILLSMLQALASGVSKPVFVALLLASLAGHLFVGWIGMDVAGQVPWGAAIALYVLFPCLLSAALVRWRLDRFVPVTLWLAIFVVTAVVCWWHKIWIDLSDFKVYAMPKLTSMALVDLNMISASFFLYRFAALSRLRILDWIGSYSLQIYFIHGVIGYVALRFLPYTMNYDRNLTHLAIGYTVTLGLSVLLAHLLMRSPLGVLVFPARSKPARKPSE